MAKRAFDIVAAAGGILLTAPLWPVIALLIRLDSPGRILYRQWRIGKAGKLFRIYKFRTMIDRAEAPGPAITVSRDTRITRVGQVLRRFELDELPSLLNVLKGEMSIVGPRPELPQYLPLYAGEWGRVLTVRPGLTDPATIAFRNEARLLAGADPEERYLRDVLPRKLAISLAYVEHRTIWSDAAMIVKTVGAIAHRGKG